MPEAMFCCRNILPLAEDGEDGVASPRGVIVVLGFAADRNSELALSEGLMPGHMLRFYHRTLSLAGVSLPEKGLKERTVLDRTPEEKMARSCDALSAVPSRTSGASVRRWWETLQAVPLPP